MNKSEPGLRMQPYERTVCLPSLAPASRVLLFPILRLDTEAATPMRFPLPKIITLSRSPGSGLSFTISALSSMMLLSPINTGPVLGECYQAFHKKSDNNSQFYPLIQIFMTKI